VKFVVSDAAPDTKVRWPDVADGPWEVTLSWQFVGGRAECVGIGLQPVDSVSASPVTTDLIRSLPLARLIRGARQRNFVEAGGDLVEGLAGQPDGEALSEQIAEEAGAWVERRGGRPKSLGEDFYREVARVYLEALDRGDRDRPLRAVVEWQNTTTSTASRWVAAARALGYLSPTTKGRASRAVNPVADAPPERHITAAAANQVVPAP
jgi:hypothetical protein